MVDAITLAHGHSHRLVPRVDPREAAQCVHTTLPKGSGHRGSGGSRTVKNARVRSVSRTRRGTRRGDTTTVRPRCYHVNNAVQPRGYPGVFGRSRRKPLKLADEAMAPPAHSGGGCAETRVGAGTPRRSRVATGRGGCATTTAHRRHNCCEQSDRGGKTRTVPGPCHLCRCG